MASERDSAWRETHDPLTGLLNRTELERLRLEGPDVPVGIVYFVIDDFRGYRWSRRGEESWVGDDRALKEIGARLLSAALPGTLVFRLESSHFIAVVMGAPVHEVTAAQLEDFRQEFATPSDPDCMTAKLRVGLSAAEVESSANIYRCMKLAHDAYYQRSQS